MIFSSFIIQANVIKIVNYECKTFILQATCFNFQFNSRHNPFFYTVQYKKCTELITVPIKFFFQVPIL